MLVFENGAFFALGKKTSKSQEPGVHRVSIIWCDCYLHNNFFSVFSPVFLFVLAFNPHQFSMLNTWNRVTDTWLTHNSSRRKYTDFVAWQKEWDRSAGHLVVHNCCIFGKIWRAMDKFQALLKALVLYLSLLSRSVFSETNTKGEICPQHQGTDPNNVNARVAKFAGKE